MLRVKKFSWNPKDKEAKVSYMIDRGQDGEERHILECGDQPKPEMLGVLQGLAREAIDELEIVSAGIWGRYDGEGRSLDPVVRSVSYSWGTGIMGASICLLVPLSCSEAPLVVNTPHKPEMPYSEHGGFTLPEHLAKKLHELHLLIERYIEGDRFREQLDLFEDAPQDEAA